MEDSDLDIGPVKNTNKEQEMEELWQYRQEVHQDTGEGLVHGADRITEGTGR